MLLLDGAVDLRAQILLDTLRVGLGAARHACCERVAMAKARLEVLGRPDALEAAIDLSPSAIKRAQWVRELVRELGQAFGQHTIMASRVHRASHSSILCDVSTMQRPPRVASLMRSHRKRRAPGSMPRSVSSGAEAIRMVCGRQARTSRGLVEEDYGRVADHGNSGAELALVAAAVGHRVLVGMLFQHQGFN